MNVYRTANDMFADQLLRDGYCEVTDLDSPTWRPYREYLVHISRRRYFAPGWLAELRVRIWPIIADPVIVGFLFAGPIQERARALITAADLATPEANERPSDLARTRAALELVLGSKL